MNTEGVSHAAIDMPQGRDANYTEPDGSVPLVTDPQRVRDEERERLRRLHEFELAAACDDAAYIVHNLFVNTMCGELDEKAKRLAEAARRLRSGTPWHRSIA